MLFWKGIRHNYYNFFYNVIEIVSFGIIFHILSLKIKSFTSISEDFRINNP